MRKRLQFFERAPHGWKIGRRRGRDRTLERRVERMHCYVPGSSS